MPPCPETASRRLSAALSEGPAPGPPSTAGPPADDPRLDTTAWRVFGRRFPRRWTLYFRVVAVLVLLLALAWWFTRDVTYVDNVKVSGIEQLSAEQRADLRVLAADFAALVEALADEGYAWQSGALPALRAGRSLSSEESSRYLALATFEVKAGPDLIHDASLASAAVLVERGWTPSGAAVGLDSIERRHGSLQASFEVAERSHGRQRVSMEVTPAE
jgi:hypothetical protein